MGEKFLSLKITVFLSTPSARRATQQERLVIIYARISIHALREEGDIVFSLINAILVRFLSTPSARRATWDDIASDEENSISIHALREEGDAPMLPKVGRLQNFYPRPPRGGRRSVTDNPHPTERFLSTPSARRATNFAHNTVMRIKNFYPRPPRGGRQCPVEQ